MTNPNKPAGVQGVMDVESAIASMGKRIEARRKAMGLTLDNLADRSGLAKSYVWEIENGKNKNPTIRTAFALARGLGWTLSDVVGVWEHADLLHPEAMKLAVQIDWLLRPTIAAGGDLQHVVKGKTKAARAKSARAAIQLAEAR